MLGDFRYAVRTLRSSPAFAAAAIVTLALGIGASTAIFSVTDAVLLRPLPYQDPERLVYACADLKTRSVYDHLWSAPDYMDLRDMTSATLEGVAAVSTVRGSLPLEDGTPEELVMATVSPNLFRVLGGWCWAAISSTATGCRSPQRRMALRLRPASVCPPMPSPARNSSSGGSAAIRRRWESPSSKTASSWLGRSSAASNFCSGRSGGCADRFSRPFRNHARATGGRTRVQRIR